MSKKTAKQTEVLFWEQMNGVVVVQKNNQFFEVPSQACETVKADRQFREGIAAQFDTAPFKTSGMNVVGAHVFDRISC